MQAVLLFTVQPGKIAVTIKSILKAFSPDLNTDQLALPKERCAGQLRNCGEAHKASLICEQLQAGKTLHLNTDGKTLDQRKINGIDINNTVISINKIHHDTAETVIKDSSNQLQKLREMAFQLNANSINWTLISSSSSNSAA